MKTESLCQDMVQKHREVLGEFIKAAETATVVSFDLFDTLLVRSVGSPSDLFTVLERQIATKHPNMAEVFARERVEAETRARDHARRAGRSEVSLEEIYAELKKVLPDVDGMDWSEVMRAECSLEVACISLDQQVKQAFDHLVAKKPCIIVSDMYLPWSCITEMLDRMGFGRNTKLFLSNDCGATKHDGTIWDVVRADLRLKKSDHILHLDDNLVVAHAAAKRGDVSVFTLSAPSTRKTVFRPRPAGACWFHDACYALLQQSIVKYRDDHNVDPYWLAVAHLVVVPAVLGLASYVKQIAQERETDKVFFLARDGLVVQKAYEAAWRSSAEKPSEYVWASRRCLNMAMIDEVTEQDLDFLTSGIAPLTVAGYLHRVDLDVRAPDVLDAVHRHFSDEHAVVSLQQDRRRLRAMFLSMAEFLRERAQTERGPLLAHLNQIGLFSSPGVIVDLGWHGSLQRSLMTLGYQSTGTHVELDGVYLGLLKPRIAKAAGVPMRTHGWLFNEHGPVAAQAIIERSVEIVELFFSAPEGGIRYVEIADGHPRPVRISDEREAPRLNIAALLHGVVEQSCAALRPLLIGVTPDELRATALDALKGFLLAPTRRDVEVFRNISHAEGFGVALYRPIIPAVPQRQGRWALDAAYNDAFWKIGFVAGLDPIARLRLMLVLREKRLRGFFRS